MNALEDRLTTPGDWDALMHQEIRREARRYDHSDHRQGDRGSLEGATWPGESPGRGL